MTAPMDELNSGGEHLKVLLRRLDFLRDRIGRNFVIRAQLRSANAPLEAFAGLGPRIYRDIREKRALEWAIERITGRDVSLKALAMVKAAGAGGGR